MKATSTRTRPSLVAENAAELAADLARIDARTWLLLGRGKTSTALGAAASLDLLAQGRVLVGLVEQRAMAGVGVPAATGDRPAHATPAAWQPIEVIAYLLSDTQTQRAFPDRHALRRSTAEALGQLVGHELRRARGERAETEPARLRLDLMRRIGLLQPELPCFLVPYTNDPRERAELLRRAFERR
jgi:hypothetical protein